MKYIFIFSIGKNITCNGYLYIYQHVCFSFITFRVLVIFFCFIMKKIFRLYSTSLFLSYFFFTFLSLFFRITVSDGFILNTISLFLDRCLSVFLVDSRDLYLCVFVTYIFFSYATKELMQLNLTLTQIRFFL